MTRPIEGSAPVRRSVLEQAVVIRAADLAPAALRVVAGLVGKDRRLFGLEINLTLSVVVTLRLVKDVHGY